MKFDVIIPYYNEAKITMKCIESVIKFSQNYRIIATSDGSWHRKNQHVEQALKPAEASLHLRSGVHIGFPGNTNRALKVTTAKFITVINNDVTVTENWLNTLEQEYLRRGRNCFIGKAGKNVSRTGRGVGSLNFPEVDYLGWWLIFSSKECFDKVGLLDEHFKLGYYEDVDFGLRAKQKGFKSFVFRSIKVRHLGGATMHKLAPSQLINAKHANFAYLKRKWRMTRN